MKYLEKWISEQKKKNKINVKKKDLSELESWIISNKKIYHKSKKFFQIIGIRVSSNFNKKNWDQPIMVQNENGVLGIIRKKFKKRYKYLLQAKLEPGNINQLQLSPSVQATESNYKQVHGGKATPFLKYFMKKRFLIKSKQSEQGLRYLNKFNTNYIVDIKEKINLPKNFRWFSKDELNYLIKKKNLINMDTISVFSCSIKKNEKENLINSNKNLKIWLVKKNRIYKIFYKKIKIKEIRNWVLKRNVFLNIKKRHFSIIGLNIKSNCREVKKWDQPIIVGKKQGFAGFIIKNFNGTIHYLCRFILKPGLKGGHISCSANFSDINDFKKNHNIPVYERKIINHFFNNKKYLYNNIHSDEGGRFYHTQIKRVVIEADKEFEKNLDPRFIWISHNQFINLIQKKKVDIEARLLFACYNFDKTY